MGMTQERLAATSGASRHAIILLEQNGGLMSTLEKVRLHIAFRVTGLASGDAAHDQVRRARRQRGLTQLELATRAGLSLPTIRSVERGAATIGSLSAVVAVLAPKATGAAVFRAHYQIKRDVRFTPPDVVEAIVQEFGPVSIDPAGDLRSYVRAERVLTEVEDGLTTRWSGRLAFVNPPFSDLTRWIARCADAWENGEVEIIVGLFPARTETSTFQTRVFGVADVLLLPRRLCFYDEDRVKMAPSPFALMVCVWGADRATVSRYAERTGSAVIWAAPH